jgi:hypothetical protein
LRDGLEQRLRVNGEGLRVGDLGQTREILRAVRVQSIAGGSADDRQDGLISAMLELHL